MAIQSFTPAELLGPLTDVEKKNAPEKLYLEGNRSLIAGGLRVAVVGSRHASPEGIKRAKAVTKALVERKIIVVSGLAAGIDTVVHTTAIAEGGKTIAILGTPLDKAYPTENRPLLESIKREHLAVSQFPHGYPSLPKNFPIRNRTMALLSDATIIVEAGEKSGTLHQGWEALRLGRLLFLLASVTNDETISWPAEMVKYGAQILDRNNLDRALAALPSFTACADVAL